MKNIHAIILIASVCFVACSPTIIPSAEVNYLGKGEQGTIQLRSIGYVKKSGNIEDAKLEAERNAFNAIFFRGIPGTDIANALIGTNEQEVRSKHSAYFSKFDSEKRFRTFIMASNPTTPIIKEKGYKKITVDLKINIQSLRKDLEQNGVIRKFGF